VTNVLLIGPIYSKEYGVPWDAFASSHMVWRLLGFAGPPIPGQVRTTNGWTERDAMRQIFFLGILGIGAIAALVYFLWTIFAELYHNWLLGRGVEQLEAESRTWREQRRRREMERLENGCDHEFGKSFGGFPPNACHKCGLERTRPAGNCDHVWRSANEPIPCSYCERCGRKYLGAPTKELT
jgi:hypothetical protein